MIKLYRYGYIGHMGIDEIEAEGETQKFWIINGRRDSKTPGSYPESCWYRTAQEAVRAYIEFHSKRRDENLRWAQDRQDKIDEASGFLLGLEERGK